MYSHREMEWQNVTLTKLRKVDKLFKVVIF